MPAPSESVAELLLAVDAGGTKTVACFARRDGPAGFTILGRGRSTGANPLSLGIDRAIDAICAAVAEAREVAQLPVAPADRAVLSIAGAADAAVAKQLVERFKSAGVARRFAVVSDVLPILAVAAERGVGIALIAGTGSVAFGRNAEGRHRRCGGWGYLLGDEGSGYAIGRAALRAALDDFESRKSSRALSHAVLAELNVESVLGLTKAVYSSPNPRATVASLAELVVHFAAEHDAEARRILDEASIELARLVERTARELGLAAEEIPLAVAGGVLVGSEYLRQVLAHQLASINLKCKMAVVSDPLAGCLRIAVAEIGGDFVRWEGKAPAEH